MGYAFELIWPLVLVALLLWGFGGSGGKGFLKRLDKELPGWVEKGWVSAAHAPLLRADAEAHQKRGPGLITMLAGLGAVLVFAGIISFVASNWQAMGTFFKIGLVTTLMVGAFVGAYQVQRRGYVWAAEGLALLGVLIFGANIMLIGQIYHLPPNPAAFMLLWAVMALLVAALWPSRLTAALAYALAMVWGGFWLDDNNGARPHYEFLLLLAPLVALTVYHRWHQLLLMAAFAVLGWLSITLVILFEEWAVNISGLLTVALLAGSQIGQRHSNSALATFARSVGLLVWLALGVWLAFVTFPQPLSEFSRFLRDETQYLIPIYALTLGLGLLMLTQRAWRSVGGAAVLIGAIVCAALLLAPATTASWGSATGGFKTLAAMLSMLVMGASVGAIIVGYQQGDRLFIGGGLALFAVKLLGLYFSTFYGLLPQSIFFTGGGLVVLGLAYVFNRQHKKLKEEAQ